MPKVQDLIAKCEESEMFTQNLQENITEMKVTGVNGRITFLTDPQIVMDELQGKPKKVGIVIWFPADVFDRK
jgi:hypothetical protein